MFAHQLEYHEMLLLCFLRVHGNTYATQYTQRWASRQRRARDDTSKQLKNIQNQSSSVVPATCLAPSVLHAETWTCPLSTNERELHAHALWKDGLKGSPVSLGWSPPPACMPYSEWNKGSGRCFLFWRKVITALASFLLHFEWGQINDWHLSDNRPRWFMLNIYIRFPITGNTQMHFAYEINLLARRKMIP